MKTLSVWITAGVVSYFATSWIKNIIWNIVAGTVVWYLCVHYINKFLEGEI
jgi:hypothetical protein